MVKFVFNDSSLSDILTHTQLTPLLQNLCKGMASYIKKTKYPYFELYSVYEHSIANIKLHDGSLFENSVRALNQDEQLFIIELFSKRKTHDKLYQNEELFLKVITTNIYIKNNGEYQQVMSLSYAYHLDNSIICSLGFGYWNCNELDAIKDYQDHINREDLKFDNIVNLSSAHELHKQNIAKQLPNTNIIYTNEFKNWLVSEDVTRSLAKIIEKLNFVYSKKFEGGRDNCIESIRDSVLDNLKEIIVGNAVGMSYGAIRIFFVEKQSKIYIIKGAIKQNLSHSQEKDFYIKESEQCKNIYEAL